MKCRSWLPAGARLWANVSCLSSRAAAWPPMRRTGRVPGDCAGPRPCCNVGPIQFPTMSCGWSNGRPGAATRWDRPCRHADAGSGDVGFAEPRAGSGVRKAGRSDRCFRRPCPVPPRWRQLVHSHGLVCSPSLRLTSASSTSPLGAKRATRPRFLSSTTSLTLAPVPSSTSL